MTAAVEPATLAEACHPHEYQGRMPVRLPAQVIRQLSVLEPRKAILAVVVEWAGILAAIVVGETVRQPLVYVAVVIWIGARQHALTVLGHDAAHYRLLPGRLGNDWVANLTTQWPMFLTLEGFRHYHGEHHRFNGTEGDGNRKIWRTHTADGRLTAEWRYPKTRAALVLTILHRAAFVTGIFWIVRGMVAMFVFPGSRVQLAARLTFYCAGFWALASAGAIPGFLRYWIVPYCTWHIACQYIRLICEHTETHSAAPAYSLTRTTLARWWERWLIVPRNIHYHIEHHWYPSVPFYNLPVLHTLLMAQLEFREQAVVTDSVIASLRQCLAG
jgi:fatty acid desaturase